MRKGGSAQSTTGDKALRGTVQSFKDARSHIYWRANSAITATALVLCAASAAADDAGVPLTNDELSTLGRCGSADAGARPDDLSCLTLTVRQVCLRAVHAPDRAAIVTLRSNAETLMHSLHFDATTLAKQTALDETSGQTFALLVQALRCNRSALAATELPAEYAFEARATKWAADADKAVALEQKAREEVINPVCQADLQLEQALAAMAHERANPSGYVDKALLHKLGADVQYYREQLAAWAPQYVELRRHPFAGWRSEGACFAIRDSQ